MPGKSKGASHKRHVPVSAGTEEAPSSTDESSVPIVGIGASAGGVEALVEFFKHLPDKTGLAFVVILHLSPERKSLLAGLLQKHTALPVTEVIEAIQVEPDHVYIIPPGKVLSLVDGGLQLSDPENIQARRVPIDQFFRTLAQVQGAQAVCMIFSGTGSDGTLGLKAIKEVGGMAMVQDPEEANYDGMPRSAIATGLVDVVAPVQALAEKLLEYQKQTTIIQQTVPKQLPDDDAVVLGQILAHLRARTGHDFAPYKRATVVRRTARRQHICGAESLSAYLERLRSNPDEPLALVRDLLITVTNFFRDPEAFAALEKEVIPKLFEGKEHTDEVRVWVAGCATGEEAYSLAMLLIEHAADLDHAPKVQIFATDISEEAIATARQGLYPDAMVADLSPERLRRFFTYEAGSYRVRKEIREVVLFAVHDLLKAPPFSKIDLLSCRNLLIYLNREMQGRVFELFHYALRPEGYLFLGTSESPLGSDLFTTVSKEHRLFQRSAVPRAAPHLPSLPLVAPKEIAPQQSAEREDEFIAPGVLHQKLVELYAPPSLVVNERHEILHISDKAGRYLLHPGGKPSNDVVQLVPEVLGLELRTALYRAFREGVASESRPVRVQLGDTVRSVRLVVRPAAVEEKQPPPFALVFFDEQAVQEGPADATDAVAEPSEAGTVLRQMEDELRATREQLRSTVEQYETSNEELKSSNEELQSINEELKSATEELETSKEELQSTNEELITVNQEHKNKIEELAQANSDLQNLMAATEIGTIFLNKDLRIKRFTPVIEKLFNITATDIGRPLAHFTNRLGYPALLGDAQQVLERLVPIDREVRSEAGQWYLVRVRTYRTVDDRIDGVVISFVDITRQKQTQEALEDARVYAENIVNTMREPLVVLDTDLQVISANQAFYDTFAVKPEETVDRRIYELGNNQWDIPRLRELLEQILPTNHAFNDFEVEHTFEQIGRRTMLLNARRIDSKQLILLAIEDITRRRAAEGQLEQEKNLSRLYLDVAGVMMVVLDRQGRVTLINQTGCNILGYPKDEVVGKDWFAHFLPERDRAGVRKTFDTLLGGDLEAVESVENPVLRKDGEERLILWHNAVLRNEQGQVVGTLGSGADITERKQAEQALSESEQRFRNLFDASPDAIFVEDWQGQVLDVNPAACRLHNTTRKVLIGQYVKALVPPEQREAALQDLEKLVSGEISYLQTYSWTINQHAIPVEIRANRFAYDGREAVLLIVRDIRERIEAEKALEESQARARAILETIIDAVITIDRHGIIESVNPATEHLFGYTVDDMVGQNVKMLMPDPYRAEHDQYIRNYLTTGERKIIGTGREVTARHKDGSTFPVDLAISEVHLDDKQIFTGFIRDIRERQRLQREVLRISEEERQRIGQDIHDELASQFSGMALLGRALVNRKAQGKPLDPEMLEEMTRLARVGAKQARALARGLSPVKLDKEGLQAALKELVHGAETFSDVDCTFEVEGELPLLESGVATQLYRIAQEAINNALKHARATKLVLKVQQQEHRLVLTINDDGVGLPKDHKEMAGMGLHIMPYRARMIGGTLTVDSAAGSGTTVTCVLPLTDARSTEYE